MTGLSVKNIRALPLVILLVVLLGATLFFSNYSVEELIVLIGIENSYLLLFAFAFLSGIMTFIGVPYHLFLIALAIGGLNPWLLGISAALGVFLGDSTSYLLGYYGRAVVPQGINTRISKVTLYLEGRRHLIPLFFFLYGSIIPFSNDFVGITMGIARYPFFKVMIPLGLGNVVFNTTLAFLAAQNSPVMEFIYSLL